MPLPAIGGIEASPTDGSHRRCSGDPDYFVNEPFRRELLRVLNRGESVNALKRAIYTGRVASFQA